MVNKREIERERTNRLLEELYALKERDFEEMSPMELAAIEQLVVLNKIEKHLEVISGLKLE